jgi:hypothetical protein
MRKFDALIFSLVVFSLILGPFASQLILCKSIYAAQLLIVIRHTTSHKYSKNIGDCHYQYQAKDQ